MAFQLPVSFSSFFVEYKDFVAFYQMRFHFAHHFGPFYGGDTYFDFTIVVGQQYLFKFNNCAVFCILDVLNEQPFSFFGFELLTVNFYDYVHFFF